jgi:hypothetical protein
VETLYNGKLVDRVKRGSYVITAKGAELAEKLQLQRLGSARFVAATACKPGKEDLPRCPLGQVHTLTAVG